MSKNFDIGVMFRCQNPPEMLLEYVQQAEAAGFDEVWIVEDCFFAGGLTSASLALAHTTRIRVGLGIMPAVVRNPAFAAMEITTLARLFPGRFLPGFGHGVGAWMKQVGAFPKSQLTALEEVTATVRALLAGKRVDFAGQYVQLSDVQLAFPPATAPPLALGVRGPKSLQLAGRVADGTILAEYASAPYVAWAIEQIHAGQAMAQRTDEPHRVTVYTFCVLAESRAAAAQKLRPLMAQALAAGQLTPYLEPLGIVDDVKALMQAGGVEHLAAHMPDDWIAQLAVIGTPSDCVAAIHKLVDAGAHSVVLVPVADDDKDALAAFANDLLPALAAQ